MKSNKIYTAIGLMSGTSLDGAVDVALLRTDGHDFVEALDFKPYPYDQAVRDKVRACFGKREEDSQTQEAERLITDIHISAVKSIFDHPIIRSSDHPVVIGFHGQTITHDPDSGFTWQLGDAARLARETGIDVVFDLRQADIKAGGQGAPLIPLYHQALAANLPKPCAVLNLGGVANVTWLGLSSRLPRESGDLLGPGEKVPPGAGRDHAGTADPSEILAFDTGPANALIDDFVAARTGQSFDENGALAKDGRPDEKLLEQWLTHPYFDQKPPKSLDRNEFMNFLPPHPISLTLTLPLPGGEREGEGEGDINSMVATLTQFTIRSVLKSLEHMKEPPKAWYVCGGGRKNASIMEGLQAALGVPVMPVEEAGWNGDALEAQGFAYLAVRSLLGLPLTLPTTTGVKEPITGGELYTPYPRRKAQ